MEPIPFRRKRSFTPGREKAITQQLQIYLEGVHFDFLYATPREVAYKCTLSTISELAAGGIRPDHLLVQCALKQEANEHLVMELEAGVQEVARRFNLQVEFQASDLSPNVTLLQCLASGKTAKRRKISPRPNDLIVVTGPLGGAAAGLNCLRHLGRTSLNDQEALLFAYLKPFGRVEEALALSMKNFTSSLSLIKDGLALEINETASRFGLGAEIVEEEIPLSPLALRGAELLGISAERFRLYGAEDYELLLSLPPRQLPQVERLLKKFRCEPRVIGRYLKESREVKLKDREGQLTTLPPRLWHPLVRRRRA